MGMASNTQMIGQSIAAAEPLADDRETHHSEPLPDANPPDARPAPDPTRYGDWEKNGRCIDF
jgi:hypothetical protein